MEILGFLTVSKAVTAAAAATAVAAAVTARAAAVTAVAQHCVCRGHTPLRPTPPCLFRTYTGAMWLKQQPSVIKEPARQCAVALELVPPFTKTTTEGDKRTSQTICCGT